MITSLNKSLSIISMVRRSWSNFLGFLGILFILLRTYPKCFWGWNRTQKYILHCETAWFRRFFFLIILAYFSLSKTLSKLCFALLTISFEFIIVSFTNHLILYTFTFVPLSKCCKCTCCILYSSVLNVCIYRVSKLWQYNWSNIFSSFFTIVMYFSLMVNLMFLVGDTLPLS